MSIRVPENLEALVFLSVDRQCPSRIKFEDKIHRKEMEKMMGSNVDW